MEIDHGSKPAYFSKRCPATAVGNRGGAVQKRACETSIAMSQKGLLARNNFRIARDLGAIGTRATSAVLSRFGQLLHQHAPTRKRCRNEGVMDRDCQLAAGRSMRFTVYTGRISSCRFSSRPSLPRTVKIVGRPAKGFTPYGVAFGGGGGSRMGGQPSVFTVNSPLSAVRFTTGKSVQFAM